MSVADLPDVLIAHLCTYLDYPDICNLMETSQKNYNAIKGYKNDKLEFEYISCYLNVEEEKSLYEYWAKDKKNNFYHTNSDSGNRIHLNRKSILEQCSSVGRIYFGQVPLYNITTKVLLTAKTKIGKILIDEGSVGADPDDFILLCTKFKLMRIESTQLRESLWNDQVFVSVMPYLIFEDNFFDLRRTDLADRTLEAALFNQKEDFNLIGTVNKFTVEGVFNAIKMIRDLESKDVRWHLGHLLSGQFDEARRIFNAENVELGNLCRYRKNEYNNGISYTIYISPVGANSADAFMNFYVFKEDIN